MIALLYLELKIRALQKSFNSRKDVKIKSKNKNKANTAKPPEKYINPLLLSRRIKTTHMLVKQIPNDGWQKHNKTHKKEAIIFFLIKCTCDKFSATIKVERIKAKLP